MHDRSMQLFPAPFDGHEIFPIIRFREITLFGPGDLRRLTSYLTLNEHSRAEVSDQRFPYLGIFLSSDHGSYLVRRMFTGPGTGTLIIITTSNDAYQLIS